MMFNGLGFHATLALLLICSACSSQDSGTPSGTATPVQVTEADLSDPLSRRPLFGDLHVHTKYSVDAYVFGTTQNGPDEAYAFARGATLDLGAIDPSKPLNPVKLTRPLDFAAVTDHSEGFGIYGICTDKNAPGYNSPECQNLRGELPTPTQLRFLALVGQVLNPLPQRAPVCQQPGVDCPAYSASIWADIQRAAAANYLPGKFTSFIAYEWTATPGNANLHRNVIFANEKVPYRAASYTETGSPDVRKLWGQLQSQCKDGIKGCDVLTIAHNSNVSMGLMFTDPTSADEARKRQVWEPLVELHQHKGASECRFDRRFGAGVGTTDEECSFEQVPSTGLVYLPAFPDAAALPPAAFSRRSFVRSVLADGLAIEQKGLRDSLSPNGKAHVNPFRLGFVGSTDTHNATPGATEAKSWKGHGGNQEAKNEQRVGNLASITRNPGGLAVVWAEQNNRKSLFDALRRRETYATSGTRPVVRFFGGWNFKSDLCNSPNLVASGYSDGVPMGGELSVQPSSNAAPRFVALAQQDPGNAEVQGTPLQRLQIVKGWVDARGATHEKVFDVAGSDTGRAVNTNTCQAVQTGSSELCAVWQDPEFDGNQRAFYYLRVLEDPVCRWHVSQCQALGVDPFASSCDTSNSNPYRQCCGSLTDPVVQQRAWASPIWYAPAQ